MVTSYSVTVPTRSLLSSDVEGLVVVPDVTVMCASVWMIGQWFGPLRPLVNDPPWISVTPVWLGSCPLDAAEGHG